MTLSEKIYQQWLQSTGENEKASFEGQLGAICIVACRKKGLTPPFEKHEGSKRTFWTGGYRALPPWVYNWVSAELEREVPLKDGARYIGRRCVNALIDEIRWHKRRQHGAQIRYRPSASDRAEANRQHSETIRVLTEAGLRERLTNIREKNLLTRLIQSYPIKLSNVAIAREERVTEGTIRKRRKSVARICFAIADGNYQLRSALGQLGLKESTK